MLKRIPVLATASSASALERSARAAFIFGCLGSQQLVTLEDDKAGCDVLVTRFLFNASKLSAIFLSSAFWKAVIQISVTFSHFATPDKDSIPKTWTIDMAGQLIAAF